MNYIDKVDNKIKEYFSVLEPNYPLWLNEYINTKELLKQKYISVSCANIYSKLFNMDLFYSSLDHSIAVALIIWHFTKSKKQTLSGLFHDIATPSFKHVVDFLNNDYMNQESTEEQTKYIIENSEEIMSLLKKDNIKIEEVYDYKIYPIADNDTPKLSSDRLEYTMSNALFVYDNVDINLIKEIYNDIYVAVNEEGNIELSFKTKKLAREFVKISSKLSVIYRGEKARYSMQLIADIIKNLSKDNLITKQDLYNLKECEIIKLIENSKYSEAFNIWKSAKKVEVSKEKPNDVYYVNHGAKVRYIDPLVNKDRISKVCKTAKNMIDKNLSYDMDNYVYIKNLKL